MRLTDVVAENIRTLRASKRLTQDALAAKAGVSVSYVSMLERGKRRPPLETIEGLARALGVPPVSLLDGPRQRRR